MVTAESLVSCRSGPIHVQATATPMLASTGYAGIDPYVGRESPHLSQSSLAFVARPSSILSLRLEESPVHKSISSSSSFFKREEHFFSKEKGIKKLIFWKTTQQICTGSLHQEHKLRFSPYSGRAVTITTLSTS